MVEAVAQGGRTVAVEGKPECPEDLQAPHAQVPAAALHSPAQSLLAPSSPQVAFHDDRPEEAIHKPLQRLEGLEAGLLQGCLLIPPEPPAPRVLQPADYRRDLFEGLLLLAATTAAPGREVARADGVEDVDEQQVAVVGDNGLARVHADERDVEENWQVAAEILIVLAGNLRHEAQREFRSRQRPREELPARHVGNVRSVRDSATGVDRGQNTP
mmetsp:Transcript_6777/g.16342  ORF Transcript_6777/g.16342 Transcript_6777/m.16342 type:complete len:214 (-) Transcript_6777:1424-2065(-)